MCDTVSDIMAYDLRQQVAHGTHSFAVGKANFMEAGEVLYITCNFIDDEWNLQRPVHHAFLLLRPGDHCNNALTLLGVPVVSGEVAAQRVVYYILDLDEYYPLMVAGEMTGGIGHLELKRLMDRKLTSADIEEIFFTANMDHVLHSIGRCLLPDSDRAKDIFSNVLDSQVTGQNRQQLLSELGLDDPLESNEQWYWCYCSLVMADHHRLLTLDSQKLLCNLWGAIYSAIKGLSSSSAPTSNLCLEELLKVRGALQSHLSAPSAAHVPLRAALEIADKAIEDSYLLWSIPLVLDPRYKLRYIEKKFQKSFDDSKAASYTSQIKIIVKKLYNSYNDDSDEETMGPDRSGPLHQTRGEQCHSQYDSHAAAKTELDDYLEDSSADYLEDSSARTKKGFDFDILNWWKLHGSIQYPMVARMARAALAMPTCSKLTSDQTAQVKSIIRGYSKI